MWVHWGRGKGWGPMSLLCWAVALSRWKERWPEFLLKAFHFASFPSKLLLPPSSQSLGFFKVMLGVSRHFRLIAG